LYVPIPSQGGAPAQGFGLRALAGQPQFALVQTEHGPALRIQAQGPIKLEGDGTLPVLLSLEDPQATYSQFRFLAYLDRHAPGPVLLKAEVRAVDHNTTWERHIDLARAIVVQQSLQPVGWQPVLATQLVDIGVADGYAAAFPRVAMGGLAVAVAGLYVPGGMVLLAAVRARSSLGRDAFK
jgi:hypothetical protein